MNNLGGLVKKWFNKNNNPILSKVIFVIFILIIFFIVLRIGSWFIIWLFSPKNNPILVKGMIDARRQIKVPQDPSQENSIPILSATNREYKIAVMTPVHSKNLLFIKVF